MAKRCGKCGATSGDNWLQCDGKCPMTMSPYYDKAIESQYDTKREIVKIKRDMSLGSYIHDNFKKPEKIEYDFIPLCKKYDTSYASIHHINDIISVGNDYEDSLVIPTYQRELVWTLKQKVDLILSILNGNPIGEFVFKKEIDRENPSNLKVTWTIIDGQQRRDAIIKFFTGEFCLPDGRYFMDLKYWDARHFLLEYNIKALSIKGITYEEELEIYYNKNFGGTSHTKEDLQKLLSAKNG